MAPAGRTPSDTLEAHLKRLAIRNDKRRAKRNSNDDKNKPVAKAFDDNLVPGFPHRADLEQFNQRFARTQTPIPVDKWTYGRELGAGTFGTATVYYHLDPTTQRVDDRITIKDCFVPYYNWPLWTLWHGDPRDPKTRKHIEIQAMADIVRATDQNKLGASECLQARGVQVLDARYYYRLYTAFYQHGDLGGAFSRQEHQRQTKFMNGRSSDGFDLPEAVIWKWLEDLAKACVFMASLEVDSYQKADPPIVKCMVHRDIKPANVFLGDADANDWPSYPKAVLGDFGGCVYTDANDPNNPSVYNKNAGTPGYRPAELVSMYQRDDLLDAAYGPLTSATNVWGVGCTLIRLINRAENGGNNPTYASRSEVDVIIHPHARKAYSKQLIQTLESCVRFKSTDRISAQEILEVCHRYTGLSTDVGEIDLANGMRTRKVDPDNPDDLDLNWLLFPSASYRLGFSLMNKQGFEYDPDEDPEPRRHRG